MRTKSCSEICASQFTGGGGGIFSIIVLWFAVCKWVCTGGPDQCRGKKNFASGQQCMEVRKSHYPWLKCHDNEEKIDNDYFWGMTIESKLPNQFQWSWHHFCQKTMLYLMKSTNAIFSNIKVTKIERSAFLGHPVSKACMVLTFNPLVTLGNLKMCTSSLPGNNIRNKWNITMAKQRMSIFIIRKS